MGLRFREVASYLSVVYHMGFRQMGSYLSEVNQWGFRFGLVLHSFLKPLQLL